MSNIPREVIKLKKSLENQANKLLEEARTDFYEKMCAYTSMREINPFIVMYYFNRQG